MKKTHKYLLLTLLGVIVLGLSLFVLAVKLRTLTANPDLISIVQTGEHFETVAFSSDRSLIATGTLIDSSTYKITLWDREKGSPLRSWRTHDALDLSFSPDGKLLSSLSDVGVVLWNVPDGSEFRSLSFDQEQVYRVVFAPDGKRLITAGGFTVRLWDISEGTVLKSLDTSRYGEPAALAISPDGQTVVVGLGEGNGGAEVPDVGDSPILLWRLRDGEVIGRLRGHVNSVNSLLFSSDGELLASAGGRSDGQFRLWSVREQKLVGAISIRTSGLEKVFGYYPQVFAVTISQDGSKAAFNDYERVYVVTTNRVSIVKTFKLTGPFRGGLAYSNDGKFLFAVSKDGAIQTWRV